MLSGDPSPRLDEIFYVVFRYVRDQDAPFLQPALSHQTLAHSELSGNEAVVARSVSGEQFQRPAVVAQIAEGIGGGIGYVEAPVLRPHQRSEFRKQQFRNRHQIALTLQHPGEFGDVRLEPVLIGILARGFGKVHDHFVDVIFQRGDLAQSLHGNRTSQVALGDSRRDIRDRTHLSCEVGGELIDVVGKIAPDSGRAGHKGLAAKLAFFANFASHVAHLVGEYREGVDHAVDRIREFGDFALGLEDKFSFQISVRDVGHDFGDTADLSREIRRHKVDVVGQIFPRSADAAHLRLAAELAFGADLARHANHFRSKAVELIDHSVDRVFQLQNLALHVHGDFSAQVAVGNSCCNLRNVADQSCQIARHGVHAVGKIRPRTGYAAHFRLAAELAFRTDLARHAGDFGCEEAQLIHHRVYRVLQFQNFAAHIHSNLARQIAVRHGRGDFRDVADLHREIGRHGVHAVSEIFPGAGYVFHVRLAAQFAFHATSRATRVTSAANVDRLIHHGVDGVLQLENFAARVDRDLGGQIALGDGGRDARNITY